MPIKLSFAGQYADEIKRNFKRLLRSALNLEARPYASNFLSEVEAVGMADNTETDMIGATSTTLLPAGTYFAIAGGRPRVTLSAGSLTTAQAILRITDAANTSLLGVSNSVLGDVYTPTTDYRGDITLGGSFVLAVDTTVKLRALINTAGGTVSTRDMDAGYAIFHRIPQ